MLVAGDKDYESAELLMDDNDEVFDCPLLMFTAESEVGGWGIHYNSRTLRSEWILDRSESD
jgi:hypothetical protein